MKNERKNKSNKLLKICNFICLIISLFLLSSCTREGTNEEEPAIENLERAYVYYVIDGDTFCANIDDEKVTVRMIGIDTPESCAPEEYYKENTDEGTEAGIHTWHIIYQKNVYLEYDVNRYDDYGRVLAYVFLEDGTLLNEQLLKDGYAALMTIQPNVKYVEKFIEAEQYARDNKIGFWEDFFSEATE